MILLLNIVSILIVLTMIKFFLIAVFFFRDIRGAQKRDPAAKGFIEILFLLSNTGNSFRDLPIRKEIKIFVSIIILYLMFSCFILFLPYYLNFSRYII